MRISASPNLTASVGVFPLAYHSGAVYSIVFERGRLAHKFGRRQVLEGNQGFHSTAVAMYGYDADFLGSNFRLPLPTFSKELEKRILSNKERPQTDFSNGYYTGYVNYSLATNKERRQPVVVALYVWERTHKV